jgi:two-component system invasion response regulator UvrY
MVDDHVLVRMAIAGFINSFPDCKVTLQADSGKHLMDILNPTNLPDIILLDINMKDINGYDTAQWVRANYPELRIVILSMHDADLAMFRLLRYGVCAFLNKEIHPDELHDAIRAVMTSGLYLGPTNGKVVRLFKAGLTNTPLIQRFGLTENELRFLEWASTDMTYKEIAMKMKISPRTVDNYRDSLFQKLDVNTRIGLALIAVRCGLLSS